MALRIRGWHHTDVGCVRELNEDSGYADPRGRFFICSDGMGGHAAGDIASQMAVWEIGSRLDAWPAELAAFAAAPSPATQRDALSVVEIAMRMANAAIHELGQADPSKRGMGCTADVIVVAGESALCGHVGDSRQYLIRGDEIRQLTTDHSYAPPPAPGEAPAKGKLTSALGPRAVCQVDTFAVPLQANDHLFLCTDGLADYFPDPREIAAVLKQRGDEVGPATLVEMARQRGGADNITIVMFRVEPPLMELPLPLPSAVWVEPAPEAKPKAAATGSPTLVHKPRSTPSGVVSGSIEVPRAPAPAPVAAAPAPPAAAPAPPAAAPAPPPAAAAAPPPEPIVPEKLVPEALRKRMSVLSESALFEGVTPDTLISLLVGTAEIVLERQLPAPRMINGEDVAWLILEGARNGQLIYPEALLEPPPGPPRKPVPFAPFSNIAALPLTRRRLEIVREESAEQGALLTKNVERIVQAELTRRSPPRK